MNFRNLTNENLIILNQKFQSKDELIQIMIEKLFEEGKITSKEDFLTAVLEREALGVTGMGDGIAIPHGKAACVKDAAIAIAAVDEPLDWESHDGKPSNLIIMLAIPEAEMEDGSDDGDEYDYSPLAPDQEWVLTNEKTAADIGLIKQGLKQTASIRYQLALPADLEARKEKVLDGGCDFDAQVTLTRGVKRVDVSVTIDNQVEGHRLRFFCRRPMLQTIPWRTSGLGPLSGRLSMRPWRHGKRRSGRKCPSAFIP